MVLPMPLSRPTGLARRSAVWLQSAGRALLPLRCLVCQAPGAAGLDLCAACAADLPWNDPACARCGLPLPIAAPACGACLRRPPAFDACFATFRYAPPLDRLLPRLKYHGDLAAGALVAALMLQRLQAMADVGAAEQPLAAQPSRPHRLPALHTLPQALVPVPLHPARLGRRGYNQALELARPLARALAIPVLPDLLHRTRATAAQTELGAEARRGNVRGAFAAGIDGPVPAHVALVDDTMTTGATVADCARALRAAGCTRIDVWVAARAP